MFESGKNNSLNARYFLSYFVEQDQLQILEFNRLIKSLNGLSKSEFIDQVSEIGELKKLNNIQKPNHQNKIHFYIDKDWYELHISPDLIDYTKPVNSLDSKLLTSLILDPILGIKDLKTSDQVDFLPGIFTIEEFHKYGMKNKFKIGFVLFPTNIDQIKLVADHGLNMPPKSTWIEPKLRSGLTIYNIKE